MLQLDLKIGQVNRFTKLLTLNIPGATDTDFTEHIQPQSPINSLHARDRHAKFFVSRRWRLSPCSFHYAAIESQRAAATLLSGSSSPSHAHYCSNSPLRSGFFLTFTAGRSAVRSRPVRCRPFRKPRCRPAACRHAQPPRRSLTHRGTRLIWQVRRCALGRVGCATWLYDCARLSINEDLRSLGPHAVLE